MNDPHYTHWLLWAVASIPVWLALWLWIRIGKDSDYQHGGWKMKLLNVYRGVYYTQSKNCLCMVHIGMIAVAVFPGARKQGWRLEVMTPYHKLRFSR